MNTTDRTLAPFTLHIPDGDVDDLHRRLDAARLPDAASEDPHDWSSGLPPTVAEELVARWRALDWRSVERAINEVPQLTTTIDDHAVHAFHRPSSRPGARPLLLLHGWPGQPTEFLPVIERLAEPEEPDLPAFHVVVPTVPGFGVSGPGRDWNAERAAAAFGELMRRLGYERYVVHGYDLGAMIGRHLGLARPDSVELLHVTALFGSESPTEENIDAEDPAERAALDAAKRYEYDLCGYGWVQSQRPQSIAYFGADSPIGLLGWLGDKFHDWSAAAQSRSLEPAIDVETLLTTASIYWWFRTLGSSARYYRNGADEWNGTAPASTVPTAVCRMPADISTTVRRFAEENNRIVRWTTLARGGHFGMLEEPDLVIADLREAVREQLG